MKQLIRKLLILALTFTLCLELIPFGGPSFFSVEAKQKSRQRKPRTQSKRKPAGTSLEDDEKRREEIHKLMLEGKYQHDGAGELLYIGNMSSVPALLRVLKDNPPIKMPDGRVLYICTAAHAIAALRKITGINGGATYEEWNEWWEQSQKSIEQK